MNRLYLLLMTVCFCISCKNPKYEDGIFDLERIDFNMNVAAFYSNAMNRENIKYSSGKQYVEPDTVNEYDLDWKGDKNKIFGIQYDVTKYSKADTVAAYKNLFFYSMSSMTTAPGDLMLVNAVTLSDANAIKTFVKELSAEFDNAGGKR